MFTVEERENVKKRILDMVRSDSRIVSGAVVGSTARGGDRWSDLDLTFGLSDGAAILKVLENYTDRFEKEFDAVQLFDLPYRETIYRVFLFPHCLQVDFSLSPQDSFGPTGSRFALLWGSAREEIPDLPTSSQSMLGQAAHHLVRAKFCIERGKLWQAEYWISAARDHVLALTCADLGLSSNYARGVDQLPQELLKLFEESLIGSISKDELARSLECTIHLLLRSSQSVSPSPKIESALRDLLSAGL